MNRTTIALCLPAAIAAGLFAAGDADAQKFKGKTRPLTTKQMMKGITGPFNTDLKKALDASEVDWEEVSLKAALLNESGHMLMEDGRCPDEVWAKSSKGLQTQTALLLEKAAAKDLEGAKTVYAEMIAQSCRVCHPVHKGK